MIKLDRSIVRQISVSDKVLNYSHHLIYFNQKLKVTRRNLCVRSL